MIKSTRGYNKRYNEAINKNANEKIKEQIKNEVNDEVYDIIGKRSERWYSFIIVSDFKTVKAFRQYIAGQGLDVRGFVVTQTSNDSGVIDGNVTTTILCGANAYENQAQSKELEDILKYEYVGLKWEKIPMIMLDAPEWEDLKKLDYNVDLVFNDNLSFGKKNYIILHDYKG